MNNRHLRSGIFFISLGVLFLLITLNIVDGYSVFRVALEYWPVIFIVIGINIIFRKNDIVRVITWLLLLSALVCGSYFYTGSHSYFNGQWTSSSPNVKIEKGDLVERGNLDIGLGGTKLMIGSTGTNLIDAYITNPDIAHRENFSNGGKTASVEFKNDHNVVIWPGNHDESSFRLKDSVIWDVSINTGAVDGIIDMTDLKVENLDLKTGAASFKIIFGNKYKSTKATIKAGASSFDIVVPKDAGVRVNMDGALIGNNLRDLGWNRENNYYISPNYNNAENKIDLDIKMGLGSMNIKTQ